MSAADGNTGDPMNGFRDPTLTNEAALTAMAIAVRKVTKAVLEARYELLDTGFSDAHELCVELDQIARRCATTQQVIQRQIVAEANDEGEGK